MQTAPDVDFLYVMKSWVLAAAVVVTCTWVARPLAGSSIESDTESAASAAAGIASEASTTVEETTSQRNLRAIEEWRRLSMNPPYPANAAASDARAKALETPYTSHTARRSLALCGRASQRKTDLEHR